MYFAPNNLKPSYRLK